MTVLPCVHLLNMREQERANSFSRMCSSGLFYMVVLSLIRQRRLGGTKCQAIIDRTDVFQRPPWCATEGVAPTWLLPTCYCVVGQRAAKEFRGMAELNTITTHGYTRPESISPGREVDWAGRMCAMTYADQCDRLRW